MPICDPSSRESGLFPDLLNPDQGRSLPPQLVKLVVLPLKRRENVDNDITKIKKEPTRAHRTFVVVRLDPLLLQGMFNLIIDRLNLPLALAAAYHKVISKAAHLACIEQGNIRRLLITGGFNCLAGYLYRFQNPCLPTADWYYYNTSGVKPGPVRTHQFPLTDGRESWFMTVVIY